MFVLQLMFIGLLVTLLSVACIMLLEKWEIDDYMNSHVFWSRYWPRKPCTLCRGFWLGCGWFLLVYLIPSLMFWLIPLALIPVQVLLVSKVLPFVVKK